MSKFLLLSILAGVVAIASALGAPVQAAQYYVSTTGSDSNSGLSTATPWRTIAFAVSRMNPGDSTLVRGGTYNEGVIRFSKSGTSVNAQIRLLNYPNESPIINFTNAALFHRILIQHTAGTNQMMGWITIEGFEIRNGYDGIKYHNLHNSRIRRNWIHHNLRQGILGQGGHDVMFDRNRINHNGQFAACAAGTVTECALDHGIYAHGQDYKIVNNLFYDNKGLGIQQNGSSSSVYDPAAHAGPGFAGAQRWIIANNTFAYSHNAAGLVIWGALCSNTRVENNIFYENNVLGSSSTGTNGVVFTSPTGTTGVQIRNNLAFASGAGGTRFISTAAVEGVHYTQSGNITTLNPLMVNAPATLPSSPDFRLTTSSPAKNVGRTVEQVWPSTVWEDFIGVLRPQGSAFDIGAYEWR